MFKKQPVLLRPNIIEGAHDIQKALAAHGVKLSIERRGSLYKNRIVLIDQVTQQRVALGDLVYFLDKGVINSVRNDEN